MILRRLSKHVKDQNWFAVGLDFIIVVAGVFVGLQVSNWNDVKKGEMSRDYYLERLASDLSQTIALSETMETNSKDAMVIIERFTAALNDPEAPAEELVEAAQLYFSEGTLMTGFGVIWGTYEDLSSTGNFAVLENPGLVDRLMQLNTFFHYQSESGQVNNDWVMPFETRLASEFDWMRYDTNTEHLFPVLTLEEQADEIRANADLIRRHAALHHWVSSYSASSNQTRQAQAQKVLDIVQEERGVTE